jgi:predicted aspartyl protease
VVLIDTGSTYNILQSRIAAHLDLHTNPSPQFSVMVGNDSHIDCQGICPNVPLNIQNQFFTLPFYLIPIKGVDVVLGIAWLRTLGLIQVDFSIPSITFTHRNTTITSFYLIPIKGVDVVLGIAWLRTLGLIQVDFSIPSITFTHRNTTITLKGDPKHLPTPSIYNQICHLVHTNAITSLHLLSFQHLTNETSLIPQNVHDVPSLTHTNSAITNQLSSYPTVFQAPSGLPPSHPHDHHIPLLPNTPLVNVKPYRYPHSQKEAMTTIIQEMLSDRDLASEPKLSK